MLPVDYLVIYSLISDRLDGYYVLLYLMIKSWTVIGRCSMFYKR